MPEFDLSSLEMSHVHILITEVAWLGCWEYSDGEKLRVIQNSHLQNDLANRKRKALVARTYFLAGIAKLKCIYEDEYVGPKVGKSLR